MSQLCSIVIIWCGVVVLSVNGKKLPVMLFVKEYWSSFPAENRLLSLSLLNLKRYLYLFDDLAEIPLLRMAFLMVVIALGFFAVCIDDRP